MIGGTTRHKGVSCKILSVGFGRVPFASGLESNDSFGRSDKSLASYVQKHALWNAGLEVLMRCVLKKELVKPRSSEMSIWE